MYQKDNKQLEAKEINHQAWNSDLMLFNHSLFHNSEWLVALSDENCKPVFINFVEGDVVVGKTSGLVCSKGWLKGKLLYCYASPALENEDQELFDACHNALLKFAIKNGISRIVIGSYDQQTQLECHSKKFYTTSRYEYVVPIARKDIKFNQNFRRNVKKAENNKGVFIEETTASSLEELLKLIEFTREKRKAKYDQDYDPFYLFNLNRHALKNLLSTNIAKIYSVNDEEDQKLCIIMNIEKEGQSFNLLAGSDEMAYKKGFASYIDYCAIKMYEQKDFLYYNLGGGTGDKGSSGLERSKAGKGGERRSLHGSTTNFLLYPGKFINPFLKIGRILPRENKIVVLLKKYFINR